MLKKEYKQTKKGKIIKLVKEIYLRNDIPCGLDSCTFCENNNS